MKQPPDKILATRKKIAAAVIRILKKIDPAPRVALRYGTPFELLVAVQLSAQCTDKKVNQITPALFKRYKTIRAYAKAEPAEFEKYIRQTGFYRNKARNIIGAAKKISSEFGGKLPKIMREMLTVSGMGRKSANIVLGNVYGVSEGIAVDTHVRRLARKLGLTEHADPDKIERDLMRIVPKKDWSVFNYLLVDYGRNFCPARPHDHVQKHCPLARFYIS